MKKFTFLLMLFITFGTVSAQVGVNTEAPKVTLDVVGEPGTANIADGFMPPRITGDELTDKTAYGADQTGAVVYATTAASNPTGQTVNVTSPGLYYFDGTVWVGIVNNENKVAGKCINDPFKQGSNGSQLTVGDYSFEWVTNGTSTQGQYTDNQINIKRNIPGSTYFISKTVGGNNFAVEGSFQEVAYNNWVKIGNAISVRGENFGVILLHSEDNTVYKITASGIKRSAALDGPGDGRFCYTVEQLN